MNEINARRMKGLEAVLDAAVAVQDTATILWCLKMYNLWFK